MTTFAASVMGTACTVSSPEPLYGISAGAVGGGQSSNMAGSSQSGGPTPIYGISPAGTGGDGGTHGGAPNGGADAAGGGGDGGEGGHG